jgi:hypothetical protein
MNGISTNGTRRASPKQRFTVTQWRVETCWRNNRYSCETKFKLGNET